MTAPVNSECIRVPIHIESLKSQGAIESEISGRWVPTAFSKDWKEERHRAKVLGIGDLSWFPRIGFEGENCARWLASLGYPVPESPGAVASVSEHWLLIRRATDNVLLLGRLTAPIESLDAELRELESSLEQDRPAGVWRVSAGDGCAELVVTGQFAREMLSKICSMDLRASQFSDGSNADCIFAHLSGVVVRDDQGDINLFRMVFDSTYGQFSLDVFLDAAIEYSGTLIGQRALQSLNFGQKQ